MGILLVAITLSSDPIKHRFQEVTVVSNLFVDTYSDQFEPLSQGYELPGKVCHYGEIDEAAQEAYLREWYRELFSSDIPPERSLAKPIDFSTGVYQTWMTLVAYKFIGDLTNNASFRVQLACLLDKWHSEAPIAL
jgi:hypothetical protein